MAQALGEVRVLEFSAGMAGPWIGRFMAHCGADVIRVESRKRPDVVRLYVPPRNPELGTQPELSPWFTDWNAGKRFVSLDLTHSDAVDLAKRLVEKTDVVVENYSTGVMEKLGLGYSELRRRKPDLIMLSTSGYGDSGPCSRYITWGPNIEALSGLATLTGFPHRNCTITQYAYPDALSALHGLFAVMCALDHRGRTGRGQYINLSQAEATIGIVGDVMLDTLANGREPQKLANRSLHAAPQGCYPCKGEDRWCAIAVSTDLDWERFCTVVEKPEWASDPRFATRSSRLENAEELDRRIESWTTTQIDYELMDALQEAGIAAGVVQNIEDQMHRDRQLAARNFFERIEHRKKGSVLANGIPLGLRGTPGRSGPSGGAVGQDNDSVFSELLGMTDQEIQRHVETGAIESPDSASSPE